MFQAEGYTGNKQENYELLIKQLDALVDGEPNVLANLSNATALLNQFLKIRVLQVKKSKGIQ